MARIKCIIKGMMRIISDAWNNIIASSVLCPIIIRPLLYRVSGNTIGKKTYLSPRLFLGPGPGRVSIGDGTFINYDCWFDLSDDIIIGANCNIAMNVHFINGSHSIGTEKRRAGSPLTGKIIVGNGTWIGADSVIMPSVTIGKGCVIGAGSLVNSDVEDNTIYFGRPAKKYKDL